MMDDENTGVLAPVPPLAWPGAEGSDPEGAPQWLVPRFGPAFGPNGVAFHLWAPAEDGVDLLLDTGERITMARGADGWHSVSSPTAVAGTRYAFALASGLTVPDPGSRHQPDDVHGWSDLVHPDAFAWTDAGWTGRPWHETVLYELHVGAFTPEGTFRAAIARLDDLAALGVTAIEVMPVADFPGRHGWGYDGTLPFAPDATYGRPEDLMALVDAAHARGLSVFLDVVYNHFGPDGNYIGHYAPALYTERHHTPWGAAINFDGPDSRPVRDLVVENALHWIVEFHMDGLRLDAVHAIVDDSQTHILAEVAERVRAAVPRDRHVHLILENDRNEASRLARDADGRPTAYTAQWNDDLHHCLHVAATGEADGYYGWYAEQPRMLGRALAEGFAYQGEVVEATGDTRGEPSAHLPPTAFVSFLQNHDQVGNRPLGDRITATARPEAVRAAAALYLLAPQIPMLFMGEEWAATAPFPYFCDFEEELAEAVRQGRRKEFAHVAAAGDAGGVPDPTAPATFRSAKLDWSERARPPHAGWLAWYTSILSVRRDRIVPLLPRIGGGAGTFECFGTAGVAVAWRADDRTLRLAANLSEEPVGRAMPEGEPIWREGQSDADGLGAWAVVWTLC